MTGHRAAGAIYLLSAVLTLVLDGGIAFVQIALGLALLLIEEQAKSDLLRLVVFVWVLFSLVMAVIAAVMQALWLLIFPVILFGGGIAALMLERLSQKEILLFSGIALTGLLLSASI